MILYVVILFCVAVLFSVIAVLIYRGKTELIHDYHQTKVTDKVAYGKAFGKALGFLAGVMALSGAVALLGDSAVVVTITLAVLIIGLFVGIMQIIRVQKIYNGGMF